MTHDAKLQSAIELIRAMDRAIAHAAKRSGEARCLDESASYNLVVGTLDGIAVKLQDALDMHRAILALRKYTD